MLAVVFTGGEPLLRSGLVGLMARHGRLVFVLITNGTLMTPGIARRIARSGNVVVLVSIEGFESDTDERRGAGVHDAAVRALGLLRDAGVCVGFSATLTVANACHLASDAFVDEMIALGCSVGYFNEYVPCGADARPDWVLDEETRSAFQTRLLGLRRRKPIVLTHFPDDEYGADNRCTAAGQSSLHINAQGDVEPCPFAPIGLDNVRRGGLVSACRSSFLRAIRERPELLRRERFACALFEHFDQLESLRTQCMTAASRRPEG